MNQVKNFTIDDIIDLFVTQGHQQYDGELVSQLEHALQCATLAETAGASKEMIVACLLHDLGHLLPKSTKNQDNRHEYRAILVFKSFFSDAVIEPIRLHVEAKKYLCAVDFNYWQSLSPASKQSLQWQGGIFNETQAKAFIDKPFAPQAVQLRKWDDFAKIVGLSTPDLENFVTFIKTVCK